MPKQLGRLSRMPSGKPTTKRSSGYIKNLEYGTLTGSEIPMAFAAEASMSLQKGTLPWSPLKKSPAGTWGRNLLWTKVLKAEVHCLGALLDLCSLTRGSNQVTDLSTLRNHYHETTCSVARELHAPLSSSSQNLTS